MKTYLMLFVMVCSVLAAGSLSAATCERLFGLKLENTAITSAKTIAPGAFTLPSDSSPRQGMGSSAFKTLPAFCRVEGVIRPTSDSHIEFEVWLPVSGWNGKYLGVGNGGFAGGINFLPLAQAVNSGYASSSTDTGHKAPPLNAEWGLGHPEKIVDYYYRAIHETAKNAKAIIRSFYDEDARHSYFSGCSNGGRQALMEAQRYPGDYDGIIAGAPAIFQFQLGASFIWNMQALEADPASYIRASKLPAIEAATLAACDTLDGVKDGVIDDPTKCHFNPEKLLCSGPETDSCLTQPQVTALKKIYSGPRNSKNGQIYPGILPGGETGPGGWSRYLIGSAPGSSSQHILATQASKYLIDQDPSWDYRSYSFDSDIMQAYYENEREKHENGSPTDLDLTAFKNRGGKLIIYHGWNDPILAPMGTVNYYQSVVSKMGEKSVDDFVRLYMVPGMQHCGGGPGATGFVAQPSDKADPQHSMFAAIERWVEKGVAPNKIIATKYKTDGNPASGVARTRPLCPYPLVAKYKGSGSTDEAANFACVRSK